MTSVTESESAVPVSEIVPIIQIDVNDGPAEDAVDSAQEAQSEQLAAPIEKPQEPVITDDQNVEATENSPIKELPESETPVIPTITIDPDVGTVDDSDDKALKSPPRKSARLSAKRRLSESLDSPIVRSESPLPRRRSTRRNSNASQLSEATKSDGLNITLSTIDETQQIDDTTILTPETTEKADKTDESLNESKSDKADESVDELASAFIEEFVEEFVDVE